MVLAVGVARVELNVVLLYEIVFVEFGARPFCCRPNFGIGKKGPSLALGQGYGCMVESARIRSYRSSISDIPCMVRSDGARRKSER